MKGVYNHMRTNNIKYNIDGNNTVTYECTGDYGTMIVVPEDKLLTDSITNVFTACDMRVEELIAAQPKPALQSSIMITWYDENTIVVLDTLGKRYTLDDNGSFRVGRWLCVIGRVDEKTISVLVHNLSGPIETSRFVVAPKGEPVIVNIYLQNGQEIVDLHVADPNYKATENIPKTANTTTTTNEQPTMVTEPEDAGVNITTADEPIANAEVVPESNNVDSE